MKFERKIKETWVNKLMVDMQSVFNNIGFKKTGKRKYVKKDKECECRYIMSIRYPRYHDDLHQMYLNPCIHVYLPEIEETASILTEKRVNKSFPTLGGSLGLFTEKNSLQEWPINNEQSVLDLKDKFENDIRKVAVKFWDLLSTRQKILYALEMNHEWVKYADYWKYHHIAIIFLENGIESAMNHISKNAKKYWEIDHNLIRERLLSI